MSTRILKHKDINNQIKKNLEQLHHTLNPLDLKNKIDKLILELINIQRENGNPGLSEE